jgi:hypothetical protein
VTRGGFDSTFRRIVCHPNNKNRVRERKTIRRTGDIRDPEESGRINRNRHIVPAFVIKPPSETKEICLTEQGKERARNLGC